MKMAAVCWLAFAAAGATIAQGSPLIIEETSKLAVPPGVDNLWGPVGMDGDDAVALGFQSLPPDFEGDPDKTLTSAYLYRRSGSSWNFVRKLTDALDYNLDDANNRVPVAMHNGVMALAIEPLHIFEKVGGDWVEQAITNAQGQPNAGHEPASDMDIDGGRIFLGSGSWGGVIYEKNGPNGAWVPRYGLHGDNSGDGDNSVGGPVDISPNWAAVTDPYNDDQLPAPAVHVFQRGAGGAWTLHSRLTPPAGHDFGDVAIRDNELFIGDNARFGVGLWRRDAAGNWVYSNSLRTASDYTQAPAFDFFAWGNFLRKGGTLMFSQAWNPDRNAFVINVFQPDGNGGYRHVAVLATKGGDTLGGAISPSGNAVLVTGRNGPYYFQLPSSFDQPATFQDTFASGNGAGWSWVPGSQFAVVQSGASRVFRQSSTAGDAGAVLDAYDWTGQSIEADVTPTAISGNDRWVGLATRRTDASNYYYTTLRSSGVLQLKRMHNGAFTTLDSAAVPWALNRTYRLRLESVGTALRVYVDGVAVIRASDSVLSHGHAALLSYRAAADYDNVIVSPSTRQTIYAASEGLVYSPPLPQPVPWLYSGSGNWQWDYVDGNATFRQTSTSGDARAAVGPLQVDDADQTVEARVRPRTFATTGDPWFGLMARYRDASNYLYVTVRKSNTLLLRKVVNGNIVTLGSVPFTVALNADYSLRLEAVGSAVRAYVNGRLVLEGTDPQPSSGRVGLVDYRTAVDYDDVRAVTP